MKTSSDYVVCPYWKAKNEFFQEAKKMAEAQWSQLIEEGIDPKTCGCGSMGGAINGHRGNLIGQWIINETEGWFAENTPYGMTKDDHHKNNKLVDAFIEVAGRQYRADYKFLGRARQVCYNPGSQDVLIIIDYEQESKGFVAYALSDKDAQTLNDTQPVNGGLVGNRRCFNWDDDAENKANRVSHR